MALRVNSRGRFYIFSMNRSRQPGDLVWRCRAGLPTVAQLGIVITPPSPSGNCEVMYPSGLELNGVAILHDTAEEAVVWGKKTLHSLGWHLQPDLEDI